MGYLPGPYLLSYKTYRFLFLVLFLIFVPFLVPWTLISDRIVLYRIPVCLITVLIYNVSIICFNGCVELAERRT